MDRSVQVLELEKPITPRVERLREQQIHSVPYVSVERCLLWTNSFRKTEGEPKEVRCAKALSEVLENLGIDIGPDELLIGGTTTKPRGVHLFPELMATWLKEELDTLSTREFDPLVMSEEDKEIIRKDVIPYWEGKTKEDIFDGMTSEDLKEALSSRCWSSHIGNYTICQVPWFAPKEFLSLGFNGLKMKADNRIKRLDLTKFEDVNKLPFLNAVKIALDAATAFIKRYAALARELREREANANRKNELGKIAEICEWISENPPRTFHEALQLSVFVYTIERLEAQSEVYTPGRLDQWLYPFYKKDIEEGTLTRDEALELLECLFIKLCETWYAKPKGQAERMGGYAMWATLNIGGMTPDGEDATNELSYLVLQAVGDIKLHLPDVGVRVHEGTPDDFLMKACEVLRLGTGNPKFYNDEQIIPLIMHITNGTVPLEEARDYYNTSCIEFRLGNLGAPGFHLGFISSSSSAPLEFALNNGVARINGKKIGAETGDPRKFRSYEEVIEAFRKQVAHSVRIATSLANFAAAAALNSTVAIPFISAMQTVCIENGVDYHQGGGLPADLQYWALSVGVGLPEAIDSFAAIKKLVFEDKVISMPELIDALDSDFEGREDLRQMLISKAPKYGNDNDYVDSIAKEVYGIAADEVYKYKTSFGGTWVPRVLSLSANITYGAVTGALPSGRKAWTPLADAGAPVHGCDRNGPTSVIKTLGKVNRAALERGTPVKVLQNMRFSPVILEGGKGLQNVSAFLKAWCELRCYQIQFNVVSSEMLRDAQVYPEKYPDLLVKVAGWSAYFNLLHRSIQDDIISRTEHSGW